MPYSVIPPYILRNIIDNCSGAQQDYARRTLTHVQQLMAEHPHTASAASTAQPGSVLRAIYDAGNTQNLPGTLIREEGQPGNGDVAADEAWNYLGITYDFYWQIYQRNSLDNKGLKLDGTVHYGREYQNAFWNGQQMVFGDGDGEIFNRFTIAIDVVAHELTHGVTETEAGLIYFQQAGALNESMSDVFGSLVKQYHLKQSADQLTGSSAKGCWRRVLRAAACARCPRPVPPMTIRCSAKIRSLPIWIIISTRAKTTAACILTPAFPIAPSIWQRPRWAALRERAGQAWYDTLCDKELPQDADFSTFARFTVQHAAKRFDNTVAQAIQSAWHEVGVR